MAKTIVVAGKGGAGKTTAAALIVRCLREHAAGPVLALDADPDANLATVLGVDVEKTIGDLREETLAGVRDLPPGMSKINYIEAGLHEIVVESDKVDLITMGRGEGPACYCYVNNLLRKFAGQLSDSYEYVVMDTEAGLEHLSRRVAPNIDALIVVVNENPLTTDCARRIVETLPGIKASVGAAYLLLNRVRPQRIETVRQLVADLDINYLGCVPDDPEFEQAVFDRRSIYGLADTPAVRAIDEAMNRLGVE